MKFWPLAILFLLIVLSSTAQTQKDSLLAVYNSNTDTISKIKALQNLCKIRQYQAFEETKNYAVEAIQLSERLNNSALLGISYHRLSVIYWAHGWYDSSKLYQQKTIKLLKETNEIRELAEFYNKAGLLYYYTAHYDSAIHFIEKSIEMHERLGDSSALARIHNNLGIVYDTKGEYRLSTENIIKGLQLSLNFDNIKDQENRRYKVQPVHRSEVILHKFLEEKNRELKIAQSKKDYMEEAKIYTDISWIYSRDTFYSQAIEFAKKAMVIYSKYEEDILLGDVYRDLGEEYIQIDSLDLALEAFNHAEYLYKNSRTMIRYAAIRSQISDTYHRMGKLNTALTEYLETLKISLNLGHIRSFSVLSTKVAGIYQKLGQIDNAIDIAKKGFIISDSLGIKNLKMDISEKLSELYEIAGKTETALKYLKIHNDLFAEYSNELNTRELASLEEEFKVEEQNKEIQSLKLEKSYQLQRFYWMTGFGILIFLSAIFLYSRYSLAQKLNKQLKKQAKLIDSKNRNLRKLISEKELLIGEVHHRVKNNLQVISSLLRLKSKNVTDPKALNIISEGQDRINTVAMIHENLFQKGIESRINLREYIEEIGKSLIESFYMENKVKISFDLEDIDLDFDRAVYIGLIINELITNSLKHAFSSSNRDGAIKVCLKREKGLHLTISDNGSGILEENKFFKSETSGINIVKALLKHFDGKLDLHNNPEGGVFIKIHINTPVSIADKKVV